MPAGPPPAIQHWTDRIPESTTTVLSFPAIYQPVREETDRFGPWGFTPIQEPQKNLHGPLGFAE